MPATPGAIANVSDTAIWVAYYRALENARRDARFKDPYAARLAGERGPAIARSMGRDSMSWPIVVRTVVIDDILTRTMAHGRVGTVLSLAAGLDARPWRMALPPALRWVEADLPDILAYKQRTLTGERPTCDYQPVAIDLRDETRRRALFADVAARSPSVFAMAEGLLIYLETEQVRSLARDLHREGAIRWWLIDLVSPWLMRRMQQRSTGRHVAAGNAPFRFAPAEGTRFFAPLGWREAEFHSMWDEGLRLKRTIRFAWLRNLMLQLAPPERRAAIRRMAGIVLLERM